MTLLKNASRARGSGYFACGKEQRYAERVFDHVAAV